VVDVEVIVRKTGEELGDSGFDSWLGLTFGPWFAIKSHLKMIISSIGL